MLQMSQPPQKKVNALQLNVQSVPEAIIMNSYADMEQTNLK